jgi:hypothetical protein
MSKRTIAIFDFGGVLIDWDPRHLYRKIFGEDVAAMEHFLSNVCTPEWNLCQDAGRSFAEGTAALARKHPEMAALIEAWQSRFDETMRGPIEGAVEILAELRDQLRSYKRFRQPDSLLPSLFYCRHPVRQRAGAEPVAASPRVQTGASVTLWFLFRFSQSTFRNLWACSAE